MLLRKGKLSKLQKFLQIINDCNINLPKYTDINQVKIGPYEPNLVGFLDLCTYALLKKSIDYVGSISEFKEDTSTNSTYGKDLYKSIMEDEDEVEFPRRRIK